MQAKMNPNDTYRWYTGEQSYVDKISKIYPNHEFIVEDRSIIPISGTQIRKYPLMYGKF